MTHRENSQTKSTKYVTEKGWRNGGWILLQETNLYYKEQTEMTSVKSAT